MKHLFLDASRGGSSGRLLINQARHRAEASGTPVDVALSPYGVVWHPNPPSESHSSMRADARRRATEVCQRHGRVPEWLSEEFFDHPPKPATPMIILMIYCIGPGSHATEEQKQARIAALRDTLAKGQMTQAEFDQAVPVVLSEP